MKDLILSFWQRLRHNLWLKLFSLVLAFVVWLVVVAYYNPETTNMIRDLPITVGTEQTVLEERGLILVTELEKTVDVKIEGRREKLAMISQDKVRATVDLSKITKAGEYDLPVVISIDGQSVNTVSQSVQTVTLKVENIISAQFTVEALVKGKVAEGRVMEQTVNPTMVKVTGPESVVSKILAVQAIVEQDVFSESGVYESRMRYLDRYGNELDSTYLTLDADSVKMNISVTEEKEVPLQLEILNSAGGNDSTYLNVEIEPKTIMITASADILSSINSVSLGNLDVSEITDTYHQEMDLILPNGVKNIDNVTKAKVTINMDKIVTKQFTLSAAQIKLDNLPSNVKAQVVEQSVKVTVRGLSDDVNKLKATDLTLAADCKNIAQTAGTNRMSAYVKFPQDVKVGAVGKYELTIKVS